MRIVWPSLIAGLSCLALSVAAPAEASDASGKFVVRGAGGEGCETFTQKIGNAATSEPFVSWLMGYLTAQNRAIPQTFDFVATDDGSDFIRLVALVCKRSPDLSVEGASARALGALAQVRSVSQSPVVTMTRNGKTARLRSSVLQWTQSRLIALHYYSGAANGIASEEFYKSIERFQKAQKLTPSGLPDIDVLLRLAVAK